MDPNERRMAIIRVLCVRRKETIKNLAAEFGVSERTVRYDIERLSQIFPLIITPGRYSGGVSVMEGYYWGMNFLNSEQQALLERLLGTLSDRDRSIMQSILDSFALKRSIPAMAKQKPRCT